MSTKFDRPGLGPVCFFLRAKGVWLSHTHSLGSGDWLLVLLFKIYELPEGPVNESRVSFNTIESHLSLTFECRFV